jgi:integral membrane protein (TIGR01906 family)
MQRPEPAEEVIYLLEELRLPEDSTQPLYNEAEISHMLDVKHLTDNIRNIFWVTAVFVLVGFAILFARAEGRWLGRLAMYRGGLATVAVLTGIALFILIGWSFFFVFFHELLFPPGTWTFYYTDSLIRLFPEQFWFDMGLILSLTPLLLGIGLTAVGYVLKRPRTP